MQILAILQLPNPKHGASFMGQCIKDSKTINKEFNITYVRISTKSNKNSFVSFFQLWNLIKLYIQVVKLLLSNKYDLIYITPCASGFQFYKDFFITLFVKLFHKNKIVYHFHNKGISTNTLVPKLIKKFFFKNVQVILLSPLLYYDVQEFVLQKNISFLPNGIQSNNNYKNHNNSIPQILFLSNMIKTKGVLVLLEACQILHLKKIKFQCSFVGPWYDVLEQDFTEYVSKNELHSYIEYFGAKYGEEKNNILNSSDIFVFPTFYPDECFPLVILEAMNYSLPCISTTEGAISEIIDHEKTGFIVQKNNAEALAAKLEVLLLNKILREEMGIASKIKFTKEYSLTVFEQNFITIINQIANY